MAAKESAIEGVYSVRLVIADFYMEKPQFGLDPCYSELRGKEIKRVRFTFNFLYILVLKKHLFKKRSL